MAIENARRRQPQEKNKRAHSPNTEIWGAGDLWRFFTGLSFEEIMDAMLDVLSKEEPIPGPSSEVFEAFRELAVKAGISDGSKLLDAKTLMVFFCT